MLSLRELDGAAERRWPRALNPTPPLHSIYFAIGMLLVSITLSILVEGAAGTTFAGGALGVLIATAVQMRRAANSGT